MSVKKRTKKASRKTIVVPKQVQLYLSPEEFYLVYSTVIASKQQDWVPSDVFNSLTDALLTGWIELTKETI